MAHVRKRATIRQVAEATGLSTAAVSYALRGLHVSEETRRRVQQAEWEDANSKTPELAGAYPPDNFLPLGDAGVVDLVEGEAQIAPGRWVVDQVRCSDLLGAAAEDREAAAMFYYGYLAAKAGIRVIDVNQIDGNVRKVMDRYAAEQNITVPQAFRQALGRRG